MPSPGEFQERCSVTAVLQANLGPDFGANSITAAQIKQRLHNISPARLVTAHAPPFLLIHGGLDLIVPLQQSRLMVAALGRNQVPAKLIVKPGGGHPWPTIAEEVALMAEWFDRQLLASDRPDVP